MSVYWATCPRARATELAVTAACVSITTLFGAVGALAVAVGSQAELVARVLV